MERSNSRHSSPKPRDLLFGLKTTPRKVRYTARKGRPNRHPASPIARNALRLATPAKCGDEPPKEAYDVLHKFLLILARALLSGPVASARHLLALDQRDPIRMRSHRRLRFAHSYPPFGADDEGQLLATDSWRPYGGRFQESAL